MSSVNILTIVIDDGNSIEQCLSSHDQLNLKDLMPLRYRIVSDVYGKASSLPGVECDCNIQASIVCAICSKFIYIY